MKILTVCERGNCRSVACALVLKDMRGMSDVLACGIQTTTPETFAMLATWADKIIVCADAEVRRLVGDAYDDKLAFFDIGGDRWGNPGHPELIAIIDQKLQDIGL